MSNPFLSGPTLAYDLCQGRFRNLDDLDRSAAKDDSGGPCARIDSEAFACFPAYNRSRVDRYAFVFPCLGALWCLRTEATVPAIR
jgi:hypothetical protein